MSTPATARALTPDTVLVVPDTAIAPDGTVVDIPHPQDSKMAMYRAARELVTQIVQPFLSVVDSNRNFRIQAPLSPHDILTLIDALEQGNIGIQKGLVLKEKNEHHPFDHIASIGPGGLQLTYDKKTTEETSCLVRVARNSDEEEDNDLGESSFVNRVNIKHITTPIDRAVSWHDVSSITVKLNDTRAVGKRDITLDLRPAEPKHPEGNTSFQIAASIVRNGHRPAGPL